MANFEVRISYLPGLLRKHFECLHLSRLVKLFVALWQPTEFLDVSVCIRWQRESIEPNFGDAKVQKVPLKVDTLTPALCPSGHSALPKYLQSPDFCQLVCRMKIDSLMYFRAYKISKTAAEHSLGFC